MATQSAASKIQANFQDLFKANLAAGDVYIRFRLTSSMTALLSMVQVQESLVVEADKITPMPGMPETVVGIMSSRGRVFCVFDLAQLLKLSSELIAPRQYQIIVLQTTDERPIYIGFAVNRLQGIMRLNSEQIMPFLSDLPADFPTDIVPYLRGAVSENENVIPILEFNYISQFLTEFDSE